MQVQKILIVSSLALLAGCVTVPSSTPEPTPSAQSTLQPLVAQFSVVARMSIRVGEARDTVKIEWTRTPPTESMKIFSPFGAQLAEVRTNQDGATMHISRGGQAETIQAASIGDLTAQALGVRLDTAQLTRWMQGRDLDGAPNLALPTESGVPRTWQVTAENLRTVEGASVAARVTAISGDIVVRVVIDEFRVVAK
jgi:outer membrane biogenesis lipoprotein LolB